MSMDKENIRTDFMLCVEVVLMRHDKAICDSVGRKLESLYHCDIFDCYDHPEYLRAVLKEEYKEKYDSILEEIRLELGRLVGLGEEKEKFFKIMEG